MKKRHRSWERREKRKEKEGKVPNTWYLRRWKKYGKPHPWQRSRGGGGGGREGWGGYRAIRGYNISMLTGACPAGLVSRCHLCQVMLL
ncbi:hypothetical protein ANTRET_LOCUS158 [Anthophora retusa]